MTALQRNQLVWLTDAAWQTVRAQPWDAQAQDLLAHWQAAQLPLVVCRQRTQSNSANLTATPVDPSASNPHIALGLPAPLQWQRRKLALDVAPDAIARVGAFPALRSLALGLADAACVQQLLEHTDALQVAVQVYGSYGWQHLSGLPCVREGSDLDLLVQVPSLDMAGQVVWLLKGLSLGPRVDGELQFPGGWAIAWREYAQLMGGMVEQVLVKHRLGVEMLDMAALRARFQLTPCAPLATPTATATALAV